MSKIYGVYMAYTKYEVLPDETYNTKDNRQNNFAIRGV